MDIDGFLAIPSWTTKEPESVESRLLPPTAESELEIMTAIQNLSNTVIANAASRTLTRYGDPSEFKALALIALRRLKARPECKPLFSSPQMFYRALRTISSHRYRLPVRRYIVDLFNLELDQDLVAAFADAAIRLPKVSPSYERPKLDRIRLSVVGRVKSHRDVDSSESEEDEMDTPPATRVVQAKGDDPILSLQPQRKLVGFSA